MSPVGHQAVSRTSLRPSRVLSSSWVLAQIETIAPKDWLTFVRLARTRGMVLTIMIIIKEKAKVMERGKVQSERP